MTLQIEQFRAARDELAAAVSGVRDSVDAVLEDLARADDSARAAAAEVARRQPAEPTTAEIMAEVEDVETALDVTRARAHETAREQAHGETVEVASAVFDVAVEDPATGATVVEEIEVTVVEAVDDGGGGPPDTVEGLFARLRAGQPEDGGESDNGDGGGRPTEAAAEAGPGEQGAAAEPEAEATAGTEPGDVSSEPDPDESLRSKRSEALDPISEQLAKRLKRALQDDQNLLLDRLRVGSGAWSVDVLSPEDDQRALYADAAAASLREAMAAGIGFAREERGDRRGRAPSPDAKAVVSMADRLAGTVVALLRRRLEDGEDGPDGGGAERVGAAYREWRGERIERLVGDWALEAFSSGVLAASGTGGGLRWVVSGDEPTCADCDDNALAGAVPAGEEFPTGHLHPPAHAGCRCLVVPTPV